MCVYKSIKRGVYMSNFKDERKLWFRAMKKCMKLAVKESKFKYLGEKVTNGAIILSNHEGASAPLAFELYSKLPIRFWGTHEMNSGLVKTYKYQTRIYYHQKKHWNLHLARLFCLLASPLTNLFYKGLNLISTYSDARLRNTINESICAIKNGQNIVIFPEDSSKGYKKELPAFHHGCILMMQQCQKHGIDAPVHLAYYQKETKTFVIDKPVMASKLLAQGLSREQLAKQLCDRCNQLGKMQVA